MLKKLALISLGALLAVIVLGVTGLVYAQTQTPDGRYGYGPGMMGGRGGFGPGGMMGRYADGSYGVLHKYMLEAWAEAFDMTVEDLQARLNDGDTMWVIAQEKGLSQDEFYKLMVEVHKKAIEAALADGAISQQQADWMLSRGPMMGAGAGFGPCHGGGFGPGTGPGRGPWGQPTATPTEPAG